MVLVTAFARGLMRELSASLFMMLLPAARHCWKVSAFSSCFSMMWNEYLLKNKRPIHKFSICSLGEKKKKKMKRRESRCYHYLSPEPELSRQVFLHDIIRELDTEVTTCPLIGNDLIHHLHTDVQDLEFFILSVFLVLCLCYTALLY